MTREELLVEIGRLPVEERIELLNTAWDLIAASPEDVPVPEWHRDVIRERLADSAPEYLAWDEARDRLKGPKAR